MLALTLSLLMVVSVTTVGGFAVGSPIGTASAGSVGSTNASIDYPGDTTPVEVAPNQTITLNGSSGYSTPVYNWSLGNGATRNDTQNVSYSYDASDTGSNDVVLTVNNTSSSETATASLTVEVLALEASIDGEDTRTAAPNETVSFSASAGNNTTAVDYTWELGNGSTASGPNAAATYDSTGDKTVTLTAEDQNGNTVTDTVTVDVQPFSVSINDSTRYVTTGESVGFAASATDNTTDVSYSWEFGNGDTATGSAASATYDSIGEYTVTLTGEDGNNNTATATETVVVQDLTATASTNLSDGQAAVDEDVKFVGDYSGNVSDLTYEWDFGDGSENATSLNATHSYDSPDTYTATLTVTDGNVSASDTVTVEVPELGVTIDQGTQYAAPGDTVDFTATVGGNTTAVDYQWNVSDGSGNQTGDDASATYDSVGSYDVVVTVTDGNGNTATNSTTVVVQDLTATADATPKTVAPGETVSFIGEYGGNATDASFSWDFETDGTSDADTQNATGSYDSAGEYNASFTVTGANGATATDNVTVTVQALDVTADAVPTTVVPGQDVQFNATVSNNTTTVGYDWTFGDGSSVTDDRNTTHSYGETGTYEATVNVTDQNGNNASANVTVEVVALDVSASANDTTVMPGEGVQFNSTVANDTTGTASYNWTFGDDSGVTEARNTTHSYDSPGTYNATVTAEDENGNNASANVTVTVLDLETNISVDDLTVVEGATVEFTAQPSNASDSATLTHNWTLEDVDDAQDQKTVSRTYDDAGSYNVTLNTTDQYGNNATDNVTVDVRDPGPIELVYVDGESDHVTFVAEDGTNFETSRSADILGPMADLDDDGLLEAPYVTSQGEIRMVDPADEQQFVANRTYNSDTKLGVGDWTGDGTPEVLYANTSDNNYLYYANATGQPTKIASQSADAVLGAVDFDDDGRKDVVYVGTSSQQVNYYNGTTSITASDTTVGTASSSIGAGAPMDFYNDSSYWVPVVDGSENRVLINASGTTRKLDTGADKSPVTGANWTGDGRLEFISLKSSVIQYTTLENSASTSTLNDADGNGMNALQSAGVAGVVNVTDTDLLVTGVNATATGTQNVTVNVTTNKDLDALTVNLTGPENTTLTLSDHFSETAQEPYTYTATYNGSSGGNYTATVEYAESTDGDVVRNGPSDDAETAEDVLPHVDDVTITDADDNGLVSDGEEVTLTVNVSGDVDSVTADLSAFGAGTVEKSPGLSGGETTLTETVTVDAGAAADDGDYSVSVTAADDDGNSDSGTSGDLTLDTTVGAVNATANTTTVVGSGTVAFDANASDANGISGYTWTFADGSTATGESVEQAYDATGEYTVTVEVTDAAGNTMSDSLTVSVESANDGDDSDDSNDGDDSDDSDNSDDSNDGDDSNDSDNSDDSNDGDDGGSVSPPSSDDPEETETPTEAPSDGDSETETPSGDDSEDTETSSGDDSADTETPSDDDTETATAAPTETPTETGDSTDATTTSTPGFGVVVAVLALLSAALLARRE